MKHILIVIVLIIIASVVGFWVFRQSDNSPQNIIQQSLKQIGVVGDKQTTSTNPLAIENLRKRNYEGSQVTIEKTLSRNASYTAYRVSYLSDGLKIFAAMNIPTGTGPFPVVVLNHGYYNPATFVTGNGTDNMADVLARNGYLTLASDYRGHGESEGDGISRGHRPEYAVDVLDLIASIKNIEKADSQNIGVWGHSMGGEVTLKVLEVNQQVKAAVLWAPTSGNAERNFNRWARRFGGDSVQRQDRGSLEIPDQQTLRETSSTNYLDYISAPIQLHHGTADVEVPYDWSVELDKNLREAKKQVEFFTYEGQDHNFKNLGWGEISPRTVGFFDDFLKQLK